MTEDKLQVSADDASVIKTELMITWRFANWYKQTGPHARVMEEMVPGRKRDVFTMANDLLANDDAPPNGAYRALIDQLKKYSTIARNGGWPQLPAVQAIKLLYY